MINHSDKMSDNEVDERDVIIIGAGLSGK